MFERLRQWKEVVLQLLRPEDIELLPAWKAVLARTMQVSFAVVRDFLEGQLTLRAMSLVYTTLLSLVPLLALTFSVLKGFGVQNQLEPALVNTLSALGDKGEEIARQIVSFVNNIKVGVLGSLGLGMLVYTVISLLHKIEKSFNYIWHIDRARPLGQRFSEYLSVVLVGPLLVFSALGVTASLMSSSVVQALSTVPLLGILVNDIGKLIPYILVIAAFSFIYIFMPNTKVRFVPAIIGGTAAGVAWEAMGWAFGTFVVNSGNYTAIYSGFAILIMFMIWMFASWLILLLGSSIAFYCQYPQHLDIRREPLQLSVRTTELLSLLAMVFIGRRYHHHQAAWRLDDLAHWLGVPVNIAEAILNRLHAAGLIMQTSETSLPYVPSMEMESLQVAAILDAVHGDTGDAGTGAWKMPTEAGVERMMQAKDAAIREAVRQQSLKDLVLAGPGDDRLPEAQEKETSAKPGET